MTGEIPDGDVTPQPVREVLVVWQDAQSHSNEWIGLERIKTLELALCETGRFLVHETEEAIFVAQTKSGDEFHNIFVIPKGGILGIWDAVTNEPIVV